MNRKAKISKPCSARSRRAGFPAVAARLLLAFAAAFIFLPVQPHASLVIVAYTNSSTGTLDTNTFKLIPLSNVENADGTWNTIGLPIRVTPGTNGYSTNYLVQNNWMLTNPVTGFWETLAVTDSSSNPVFAGTISRGQNANPFYSPITVINGGGSATNAQPPSQNLTNWSGVATGQVLFVSATNLFNNWYLASNAWYQFTNGATALTLSSYLPVATYNAGWGALPTNIFSGYLTTVSAAATYFPNASTNQLVFTNNTAWFDPKGAATAATNALGSAAFTSSASYDAAGAATAVTNTPSLVRTNYSGVVSLTNSGNTFNGNWLGNVPAHNAKYRQFDLIQDFGATNDGFSLFNISVTAGLTNLVATGSQGYIGSTMFITNQPFSAGDVGKTIMIYGVGAQTNCFTTTIAAYGSPTNVTLSAPVYLSSAQTFGVFGHTNDAAIQSALNQITNGDIALFVPVGCYLVGGNPYGSNYSQLYVPPVGADGNQYGNFGNLDHTLRVYGLFRPKILQAYFPPRTQNFVNIGAACFWSTITNLNGGSMFAGTNYVNPVYSYQVQYNAPRIEFEDIQVEGAWNNNGTLLNLTGASSCEVAKCFVNSGYTLYNTPKGETTNTFGIQLPPPSSSGAEDLNQNEIIGFDSAITGGEHVNAFGNEFGDCRIMINYAYPTPSGGHLGTWYGCDIDNCQIIAYTGGPICSFDIAGTREVQTNSWAYFPTTNVFQLFTGSASGRIYLQYAGGVAASTNEYPGSPVLNQIQYNTGLGASAVTNSYANQFVSTTIGEETANYLVVSGSQNAGQAIQVWDTNADYSLYKPQIMFSTSASRAVQLFLQKDPNYNPGYPPDAFDLSSSTNAGSSIERDMWIDPVAGNQWLRGLLSANKFSSTNGYTSFGTNTLTFTSVSSLTNTLPQGDGYALITAGTSVTLQDYNGNTIKSLGTIATILPVPMRANYRLSGTSISATLY